ncbi:MAG: hypothetical protein PGN37_05930 [Mycobacterium kyogaense]
MPLPVEAGVVKVNVSPSLSRAVAATVTAPVTAFGVPALTRSRVGLTFFGLMVTVTGMVSVPPERSATVTVKASVVTALPAPGTAAACRAAAVGV